MNQRELKQRLKNAYAVEESTAERSFIRKHEQTKLRMVDILRIEFTHMGIRSLLAVLGLLIVLYLIGRTGDVHFMWCVSGIMPVSVLLFPVMLKRSERYGMQELEAACRFSTAMLRSTKLFMLGGFSLVLLLLTGGMCSFFMALHFIDCLLYVAIPYMIDVSFGLLICRKWHGRESLYLCMGMTAICCLLPYVYEQGNFLKQISKTGYTVLLVGLVVFATEQARLFSKESEVLV